MPTCVLERVNDSALVPRDQERHVRELAYDQRARSRELGRARERNEQTAKKLYLLAFESRLIGVDAHRHGSTP